MSENKTIEGLTLIYHNAGRVNLPDDPAKYGPWRLYMNLRPPEFMKIAFACLYGNEEVVVRSWTKEALEKFVELNNFRTHERMVRLDIQVDSV